MFINLCVTLKHYLTWRMEALQPALKVQPVHQTHVEIILQQRHLLTPIQH